MDFWTAAEKYGLPVAMLLFAVVSLYFDVVVSGRRYRDVVQQRDRLLRLALSGQRKAWQATDVAEAIVSRRDDDDEGAAALG